LRRVVLRAGLPTHGGCGQISIETENGMTRFHVHVGVADIDASIEFYTTLFAAEPTLRKPDYAKWMLENPRVNFAISQGRGPLGIHHLGIQAADRGELGDV